MKTTTAAATKEKRYLTLYSYDCIRGRAYWEIKKELVILGLYKSKKKAEEAIAKDIEKRKDKKLNMNCIDYKIVPLVSGEAVENDILSNWIYPID